MLLLIIAFARAAPVNSAMQSPAVTLPSSGIIGSATFLFGTRFEPGDTSFEIHDPDRSTVLVHEISQANGGTLYFIDSFEDEEPRKFGLTFGYPPQKPPVKWGADCRDWLDSYIEVQESPEAANEGNKGIYFYTPGITEPGTNDNMLGVFVGTPPYAPVLYASWHQKFETLPSANRQIRIFLMSGGSYGSLAGDLWYDGAGKIILKKMLDNGEFSSITVPYILETYRWYHFEVMYKYGVTDGEYRVWIDDQLVIEQTGMNTTPFDGLDYLPHQFQPGLSHALEETQACWMDYVVAADYVVGREVPSVVHSGVQSVRLRMEKIILWGATEPYEVLTDMMPNGWVNPETGDKLWGPFLLSTDLPYNPYDLDVDLADVVPDEIGKWHWTGDYVIEDSDSPTGYSWVDLRPRCRITSNSSIMISSGDLYTRIYAYFSRLDGYFNILEFFGRYEGAPHGTHIAQLHLTAPPGATEISSLQVSPFGQQWSDKAGGYPGWRPIDSTGEPVTECYNGIPFSAPFNQWNCFEMRFAYSDPSRPGYPYNGGVEVWVNELKVLSKMDINTETGGGYEEDGWVEPAPPQGSPWTGDVLISAPFDVYLDDWVIDTNYIGP